MFYPYFISKKSFANLSSCKNVKKKKIWVELFSFHSFKISIINFECKNISRLSTFVYNVVVVVVVVVVWIKGVKQKRVENYSTINPLFE